MLPEDLSFTIAALQFYSLKRGGSPIRELIDVSDCGYWCCKKLKPLDTIDEKVLLEKLPSWMKLADFICPITLQIMRNPVIVADGYTYEHDAIEEWIHTRERIKEDSLSPVTMKPLPYKAILAPNFSLRNQLDLIIQKIK